MSRFKSRLKKLLKWGGIVSLFLGVYFFGMYSYYNEDIRSFIFSAKKIKNLSYSNYQAGQDSQPPEINLLIPDSSQQVLDECQQKAMEAGILRDKNKKEVAAQLLFFKDTFEVTIRLKGDYSDHWSGDKWSYRVKMKGEDRLFGMKSFSIQSPETRGGMNEWYFHKLLKHESLIALRYGFILLKENGESKGIYAVEESFDKQLIEFNNRREAPILKFDESILIDPSIINFENTYPQTDLYMMSKIDVFKGKRTLKSPLLFDQYQKGKTLLEKLRSFEIEAHEGIDIQKAATLFAIADITGGHHGLRWKNIRFYYNPVIGKLELIGFDSNSGHLNSDIYYNRWKSSRVGEFEVKLWKDIFFSDTVFVNAYINELKRISDSAYLEEFHNSIEGQKQLFLSYLYKDNSSYVFFQDHYTQNAKMIRKKLEDYHQSINADANDYFVSIKTMDSIRVNDQSLQLKVTNYSQKSIEILGLFNPERELISTNKTPLFIDGRVLGSNFASHDIKLNLAYGIDTNQIKLKRKDNKWVHKKMKIGYHYAGQSDTIFERIESFYNPNITSTSSSQLDLFEQKGDAHFLRKGNYEFNQDIHLSGLNELQIEAGTSIDLTNHAVLAVNGAANWKGTENYPIHIFSSDGTGSVLVYQSIETSYLSHVHFDNLTEAHQGKWHHSGAVNFYEADVELKFVSFTNNYSEDALNIVRSTFKLEHGKFENVYSDAFDGDFCVGKILNVDFNQIGNDAIDFSGSQIFLDQVTIRGIGDKAISAGEMSRIEGKNVTIRDAEMGLVSKDLSLLKLTKLDLDSVKLGYTAFRKKEMFGPARIELYEYSITNFEEPFLLETRSQAFVNKEIILPNRDSVSQILYGNLYGKSSK